jgi:tetratricopeptide (TPR) repeat protein
MGVPAGSEVSAQVEAISKSEVLRPSKRGRQLLRYLVDAAVQNVPKASLKETVIGVDVFGRAANYNPKKDAIVRVSVGDLRARLARYYETEGRADPVRITIPPGSYIPTIYYEPDVLAFTLSDGAAICVANAKVALERRTLQGYDIAFKYLDLALKEYPGHPRILSLKAMVHSGRALYGRQARGELEEAEALIEEAKRSPHEPWERPLAEAWVQTALHLDWTGGEALFDRAIALSHGEARYDSWYTGFLASQLRMEECLKIVSDAAAHSSFDRPFARGYLALYQIMAGRLDDAEETLRTTFELFPRAHYIVYVYWAMLHEARNNFAEAAKAIEQVPITAAESTVAVGLRPLMIGLAGDRDTARRLYESLKTVRQSGQSWVPASQLGNAAIGVGDYDSAAAWFREAVMVERDPLMNWLAILPFERHLYHHPDFRALVKEMKLKFQHEPCA